jgi:hypothetical protein
MFILSMKPKYPIQWGLFKYFLMAFFVGQVITFVQHKLYQRRTGNSVGAMFVVPYLRILPMHLTILIPAFFPGSNLGVFLILKGAADVLMYIITKPKLSGGEVGKVEMVSQQTMNM